MARSRPARLIGFLVVAFGVTVVGVLVQRPFDAVLAVEQWSSQIESAAEEAGLPDPFLLAGLVIAESRGKPDALSSIGAQGFCQLLPSTAGEISAAMGIDGPPYSPADNLRMGARYLRQQARRFDDDYDLGLLAFRMGYTAVRREIDAAGSQSDWLASLKSRKPSQWEYRTQVIRFRERFRERAAEGIGWSDSAGALAREHSLQVDGG